MPDTRACTGACTSGTEDRCAQHCQHLTDQADEDTEGNRDREFETLLQSLAKLTPEQRAKIVAVLSRKPEKG